MNSDDNNDNDGGGQPNSNRSNHAPPNNNQSVTNHSPYFSGGLSRENESFQASNPASSPSRDTVNWEATAALLGGSGRSPGVAGIGSGSNVPHLMDNDDDTAMDTASSSLTTSQQYEAQLIPGMESTKPLPSLQNSRRENQQQVHHPDLPFLVTHWIAHYNSLQYNDTTNTEDSCGNTFKPLPSSKTHEQKAKEDEARRRIQRAAADLAWSFQTLGAFGTNNTDTSSLIGRPATYSDMAREFAPLLATSTASSTTATANSGQNDNKSVALLDSLVTSSSLTTSEATKNVLENTMPCSFLEAAYEGSVPGEGSCLIDNDSVSSSLAGAAQARNNEESTTNGRRVGESTSSSMDANASLEWLVPTNESSGSAMQNPVLLGSNPKCQYGILVNSESLSTCDLW